MCFAHVCAPRSFMPGVYIDQKRTLYLLVLKLMRHHVGAGVYPSSVPAQRSFKQMHLWYKWGPHLSGLRPQVSLEQCSQSKQSFHRLA